MSLGSTMYDAHAAALQANAAAELVRSLRPRQRATYSLATALGALIGGDLRAAPLEFAVSQAIERESGIAARTAHSLLVPIALLRRDLTASASAAGGYLVGTDIPGAFDVLRARSVALRLGATLAPNLTGNATLAKVTTGATAYWVSTETTQITESTPTVGQLALTPKTVGTFVEISRQLLTQSALAERVIARDLGAALAAALDAAVIAGTGASGQPTGIVNTAGVNAVAGAALAWGGVLDFMVNAGTANSDFTGFAAPPAIYKLLASREKAAGSGFIAAAGQIDGRPLLHSTGVPAGTLIGGPWEDVLIGEWGVLELSSDAFTKFQTAIVGIRAFWTVDVGVLRPGAFSVATSIT